MAEKNALTLYWSKNGNTGKVAEKIHLTLIDAGLNSDLLEITEELEVEYLDYSLVFIGVPVYSNLPPEPAIKFLQQMKSRGVDILPGAPEKPGIGSVVFCTYGGGHTGFNEALPCLKYMGQFLEHEGIRVIDEWAVLGSFPEADREYNETGRSGTIVDRPNENDLLDIEGKVRGLLKRMSLVLALGING